MGARSGLLRLNVVFIFSVTFLGSLDSFGPDNSLRLSFVDSATAATELPKTRSSKKKKASPETPILSTKEEALRHLNSIPQSSAAEPPSIMMPLKADYEAIERRAWEWALELEVFQRHLDLPRPSNALGPANLNQLPEFNFVGFGVGMEKTLSNWRLTGLAHVSVSVESHESTLPSGAPLDGRYQWVGYGFEPRLAYVFNPHWSIGAGLGVNQVSLTQSSIESELAQWTRSYSENTRRIYAQYSWDSFKYVALQSRQFSNEFSSSSNWSLAFGARW